MGLAPDSGDICPPADTLSASSDAFDTMGQSFCVPELVLRCDIDEIVLSFLGMNPPTMWLMKADGGTGWKWQDEEAASDHKIK